MNAISFGIMIPILPNLIKQFVGGDTASASEWNVLFATTWGAMQFLCGPVLGMLSDRFGRRPVMLISIFGLFVDFLFMAFAPTLAWLYVGRILNGITASSFSTANAYVADITPPDRRARNFGIMGSAFGFGFMIGPILGGVLGEISLRLPFMVAAGLCLVNWLYGLLVLPESLRARPADHRLRLAARQSRGLPGLPEGEGKPAGASQRWFPLSARPDGAADHLRALHRLPLRLVAGDPGVHLHGLGRGDDPGADVSRRPGGGPDRRTWRGDGGRGRWGPRVSDLCPGAHRTDLSDGSSPSSR